MSPVITWVECGSCRASWTPRYGLMPSRCQVCGVVFREGTPFCVYRAGDSLPSGADPRDDPRRRELVAPPDDEESTIQARPSGLRRRLD